MNTETIGILVSIGFIIVVGFVGNLIFVRFKIPDVLILIALGMILGPDLIGGQLGFMTDSLLDSLNRFRDIILSLALIIILFDGGLNLDIRSIKESMRLATVLSILAFFASMFGVGLCLSLVMGMNLLVGLCLGAIVGGTSSAMVLPIVCRMRILPKTKAMLAMESVLTDVFVVVAALTLFSVISIGVVEPLAIVKDLISKFFVGAIVGLVVGIFWLFALNRLKNQPLSYMMTLAVLIITAALVELPPLSSSGAISALVFGLVLSNRETIGKKFHSDNIAFKSDIRIQQFHTEITFFIRAFFFVYLGMFFSFDSFTTVHLVAGAFMISMIVLARWGSAMTVHKVDMLPFADSMAVFALMPRGLAAAVMATIPATLLIGNAYWNNDLTVLFLNTTLIVILGTTILTTILTFATEKSVDRKIEKERRARLYSNETLPHPDKEAK
jgi:potassium/hydrogen antiporter